MATYVNNLRLTELATGEGSGTWGTTTNTNLELIGEALGYGSEAIANASTHTITVADGTADSARSFYLKLTGGGQACTVTLAPNTLSKVWMVENTTNSTLTFSQGSGANVAVPAGQVKMIATDGAGSGAVVYDLLVDTDLTGTTTVVNLTSSGTIDAATVEFNSLSGTGSVAITDILDQDNMSSNSATALATQQSIKAYVDSSVASFDTLAEVLAQGNTTGSTDIEVTTAQKVQFRDSAIYINSSADGQLDIVADTEIQLAATTIDINGAINASGDIAAASLDISGNVDIDGVLNVDAIDIDGAVQLDNTLTVGVDDTGYDVKFYGATGGAYMLWDESADDLILAGAGGLVVAGNVDFNGDLDVDGTTNLDVVDIDGAVDMASTLTVAGNVNVDSGVLFVDVSANEIGINTTSPASALHAKQVGNGTSSTYAATIENPTATAANALGLTIDYSGSAGNWTNGTGGDFITAKDGLTQFRVTGAGGIIANAASTITTSDNLPQLTLISTDADAAVGPQLNLWRNSGSAANGDLIGQITFTGEDSLSNTITYASIHGVADQVDNGAEDGTLRFSTRFNDVFAERLAITQTGGVTVNDTGIDADFRVESSGNANMLFVDGGNDAVGIGTAPSSGYVFHINAGSNGKVKLAGDSAKLEFDNSGTFIEAGGNMHRVCYKYDR